MTDSTFINYRRDDSGAEAKLIADTLRRSVGPEKVFIDTESIDIGEIWPERLQKALVGADCALVVIGPKWLKAGINEWGQRRIDIASDWVRQEIALALKDKNKNVIPILVNGAKMPPSSALPDNCSEITTRQAIELRRNYWENDIKLLTLKLGVSDSKESSTFRPPNPIINSIWDNLSPSLQDALSLAANAARREGKDIISTRTLFSAMRRLQPDRLSEFFRELPEEALPKSVPEEVSIDAGAFSDIRLFSGCVQDSLNNLVPQTNTREKLSTEDIFLDIARYGKGDSVRQLRTHGISVNRINELVGQLGWSVLNRENV